MPETWLGSTNRFLSRRPTLTWESAEAECRRGAGDRQFACGISFVRLSSAEEEFATEPSIIVRMVAVQPISTTVLRLREKVRTRFIANTVTAAISVSADAGSHDQAEATKP